MSFFIPGISMPEQTDEAIIVFADGSVSLMSQDGFEEIRIPFDGIKAVEIKTPHGRLIDADALWNAVYIMYGDEADETEANVFMELISKAQTIIEAEGGGEK